MNCINCKYYDSSVDYCNADDLCPMEEKRKIISAIQTELDLLNASDMSSENLYQFACKIKEIITINGD